MSVHVFVFGARGLSAPLSGAALASWLIPGSRLPPQKERPFTQRPTSAASPRCPDDCPACRLASTPSAVVEPVPLPVRPWREVKSRRGARHSGEHRGVRLSQPAMLVLRHQRCSDPRSRWRWQAWQGRVHPDVSLSSLPHHVHSPAQHSFISPETPFPASRRGADRALAEGLDPSAAARVFGSRHATITTWLTRAGEHAQTLHKQSFCHLHLLHIQLDELRTRLRSHTQVQWLWLAIDPCTKILPVLHVGPHTQNAAHQVIHSLRQMLAPGCLPLFMSDGLNLYFYAALGPFWRLAPGASSRQEHASVAGGGGPDLRPSEEKLPATQASPGLARDASWHRGRSHRYFTGTGFLWTAQYRFYRAGESDRPPWNSRSGSPHLGHGSAGPTAAGPPRVVASLLPFCPSSRSAAGEARAAARPRGQAGGATLSAADTCDGCGQNTSTMDSQGGAHMPFAAAFRLRGSQARWGAISCPRKMGEGIRRQARIEPHSRKRRPLWTASSPKTGSKWVCRGLVDLSTISNRSTDDIPR